MPAPSIPVFNGQIKTPWRGGYTSSDQLAQFSRECREPMDGCVYRLLWKNDSLMPFQFIRPFSMSLVTSWKLYDGPEAGATEVLDLTAQIDLLTYHGTQLVNGASVQYVTYLGTPLADLLDAGTYYMRIVSGGVTYYWEPLLIVCDSFGANVLPDFTAGLFADDNLEAPWYIGTWTRILQRLKASPGAPDEDGEEIGDQVANTGDDNLYTWNGSSWDASLVGASQGWYDLSTGNWYVYSSGWLGDASAPLVLNGSGACWNGDADIPVAISLDGYGCTGGNVEVTVVVEGLTAGTVTAEISGTSVEITEDGSYTFTSVNESGYELVLTPDGSFDGCVTSVTMACALAASDCFYRLDWNNCGNIGNTYLAGGFTNSMYLERSLYPVRPTPDITIESKQRADGSVVQTSRRRETTWQIGPFMAPWYVADALADVSLYDNVQLRPVGGGADVLIKTTVEVENEDDFAECWKTVTISFQIDASAVACCDDFAPPCKEPCTEAAGFTDFHTPVEGLPYLLPGASQYAFYNGAGFDTPVSCASGLANVMTEEDFAVLDYTAYFDLNTGVWASVAIIGDITVTPDGDGCTVNIEAILPTGYAGVLQYLSVDDEWITDETYNLTAPEWGSNLVERVTPADENASKTLRIMVYVDGISEDGRAATGRCIIGYSEEFVYACA